MNYSINTLHKKLNLMLMVSLISLSSYPLSVQAGKVNTPENIPGTTKISAEDLITIINDKPELIIIDSRMDDRAQGYIEGSISLPDIDTTCKTLANHLPRKTTPVAFFCNGIKCGRSVIAARIALKCGYKNIYWYRKGFIDWKDKGYPFIKTK